ncbi:MAG: hypothetical protein H6657_25805 [Ardenticatenaceae bacterium]|nr:hypothetical protein [Ardenticatenaceae bacterium]
MYLSYAVKNASVKMGLAAMLLLAILLSACVDVPPAPQLGPNKLGVHLLLDDGRFQWPVAEWEAHLAYARQAVGAGGYVTELVRLDDLDVAKWQQFMDLCAAQELTPILRLATTYDTDAGWWLAPTLDDDGHSYKIVARDYARFIAALNWPGENHFLVVGNEPNHGDEWSGRPDPAAYARFLLDTAVALKEVDKHAFVLNAGLDPYAPNTGSQPFVDGLWYMDSSTFLVEMVDAQPGLLTLLDGWASHAYPLGPFAAPPWEQTFQVDLLNDAPPLRYTPPERLFNRGVNGYEWELWLLDQLGAPELPVFITETGWRHSNPAYPAADLAADYLDLALRGNNGRYPQFPETGWTPWLDDARVVAITPFALDGNPAEWGHTNWLDMSTDGRILGWQIDPAQWQTAVED